MQNVFSVSWKELKEVMSQRFLRVALLVVSLVPLLYGGLYLWAFWDPYAHMQDLPVAVVNEDTGSNENGQTVNYGDNLVSTLKENQVLKWSFVSEAEAENGLNKRNYYLEVYIPTDFSSNIESVNSSNPSQAKIQFKAREASNLLAAQVTNRYISELVNRVNTQVSSGYYQAIFSKMHDSALQVQTAADGAATLADGLKVISTGSGQLLGGLQSANTGAASLNSGLNQLSEGTVKLVAGATQANTGMQTVSTNMKVVADGGQTLSNSLNQLNNGYSQLYSGLQLAGTNLPTLQSGASTVQSGLNTLSGNLSQLSAGSTSAKNGLSSSATALTGSLQLFESYASANPSTATDPTFQQAIAYLSGANTGVQTVDAALGSISTGLQQATAGSEQLAAGQNQVAAGVTELNNKMTLALDGATKIKSGLAQANTGASSLSGGLNKLNTGVQTLSNGLITLQSGLETYQVKQSEAVAGSAQLLSGLETLQAGATDLNNGLAQANQGGNTLATSLQSGATSALNQSDAANIAIKLPVLSNPVVLSDVSIQKVANYGTGFSPYFIPLALWVGALLMFFVVGMDDLKIVGKASARQLVMGKYIVLAAIGVLQAVFTALVLRYALGLHAGHPVMFCGFLVLMSWCFIAIMQFLVGLFADAGKFIGIVLLMLQLTSCAGTFPAETIPSFFQKISPWLPMTYATLGLREIISGNDMSAVASCSAILLVVMIVFLALLSVSVKYIHRKQVEA